MLSAVPEQGASESEDETPCKLKSHGSTRTSNLNSLPPGSQGCRVWQKRRVRGKDGRVAWPFH